MLSGSSGSGHRVRGGDPWYTIGLSYKCLVFLDNLLPCGAVRRLLYLLYAK